MAVLLAAVAAVAVSRVSTGTSLLESCATVPHVPTCKGSRPQAPSPYDFLAAVPPLTVTSLTIEDGKALPLSCTDPKIGGDDISPDLRWEGAPNGTLSFAITAFDPDAPTTSGFWHWFVYDIPANVSSVPPGAGAGFALPAGAKMLLNDNGLAQYSGPNPPLCHGVHRYLFAVHALPVATLPLEANTSCAVGGFNMFSVGELARGIVASTYALWHNVSATA